MRLSDEQQAAIVDTARKHFGKDCRVILFGSRVDDSRRGGDIDLFVEVSDSLDDAWPNRIPFLVELKKQIGDRRIDLVLRASDSAPKEVFRVAEEEGVILT